MTVILFVLGTAFLSILLTLVVFLCAVEITVQYHLNKKLADAHRRLTTHLTRGN